MHTKSFAASASASSEQSSHAVLQTGRVAKRTDVGGIGTTAAQRKYQEQQLALEVQTLTELLQRESRENCRLKTALAHVESGLHLLDHAQAKHLQSTRLNFAPASAPASLPTQASSPPAWQHSTIALGDLPEPGAWDCFWDARVQSLSALDMAKLHRQWLREVAMLVPKAQVHGSGSPAYHQLLVNMDRYTWFNHNAMVVAPEVWAQRSRFNLETLQPTEVLARDAVTDALSLCQGDLSTSVHVQLYSAKISKLQAEYQALSNRHNQMLPSAQFQANVPTASHSTETLTGYTVAMDETLALMQSNLWRQRLALQQCLHAVWKGFCSSGTGGLGVAQAYLTTYPQVLDIVNLVDVMLTSAQ